MRKLTIVHGFIRNRDRWPKALKIPKPCFRLGVEFDANDLELEKLLRDLLQEGPNVQIFKKAEGFEVFSSAQYLDQLVKMLRNRSDEWACHLKEVTGLIAPQFSVWMKIKSSFGEGRERD